MELRERILSAAAQLYSETGFRGATTRRIAERAGVNEVTLFRQFGSKTHLLQEAIRCAGTSPHLCELPAQPVDPRQELREWAQANYRELRNKRSLIRTAMGEIEERPDILPLENSATVCAARALGGYLARLRAARLATADFDLTAATTMFMGTLFADAMSRDIMPQMYQSEATVTVDQYVDLFLRAIGVEGA